MTIQYAGPAWTPTASVAISAAARSGGEVSAAPTADAVASIRRQIEGQIAPEYRAAALEHVLAIMARQVIAAVADMQDDTLHADIPAVWGLPRHPGSSVPAMTPRRATSSAVSWIVAAKEGKRRAAA